MLTTKVIKRTGEVADFDPERIRNAILTMCPTKREKRQ